MKLFKLIVSAVLVLATLALLMPRADAQQYIGGGQGIVPAGTAVAWTNRIAGSTSVTNYTRYALQGQEVMVSFDFKMAVAGTTNNTIYMGYSVRPESNYVTMLSPVNVAATGTSQTFVTTNYSLKGAKYFWVVALTNGFADGTSYLTNYNVYVNSR